MFDGLFPEAADAELDAQMRRPPAAPPPVPWFRGAWSATAKAIPRAGAEMGRAMTSLMTPEAVGALDAPTMFSAPAQRPKADLAAELREQDEAIRGAILEMTPDPTTTGAASMILHDVGRFVGKAAAYSALGGMPGAVAGMALDEGTNEALRRIDEGVDPATAAKLGATKGIASGIAVALPVAGKTLAQTLGLAGAGGPAAFIVEQATARKILQDADYDALASDIDPFDPIGLGVSFLGPLLFGAGVHVGRGARARADAAAADARMLADSRPPGERTQVARAAQEMGTPTREQVDAAHVALLQAQREGSALHAADDMPARAAHADALARASEQLAAGQRVSVADLAPPQALPFDTPAARAVLDQIDVLMAERAQLLPQVGELADRGEVVRMREELRQLQETRPAEGPQAERQIAKEIQAQEGIGYKAALSQAKKQLTDQVVDFESRVARLEQAIETNARAQQAEQRLAQVDDALDELQRQAPAARLSRFERAMTDAVAALRRSLPAEPLAAAVDARPMQAEPAATRAPAPQPEASPVAQITEAITKVLEGGGKPADAQPSAAGGAGRDPAGEFAAAEADRLVQAEPDMLVLMEGMDEPVRASELLAEARAMEQQEIVDAPLLRVAAECALRG